jgi:hypothetical protein
LVEEYTVSQPKFFRADEDEEQGESPKPTPGDWFGTSDQKFRAKTPAFSFTNGLDPHGTDGWRDFFKGSQPRDPLWNPLLSPDKKAETIKFRDKNSDRESMIWVLEHAAEIFEAGGHIDLAAECEALCELAYLED